MISSVIAKLAPPDLEQTIQEIVAHPMFEAGELIDQRSLPITIEAADGCEMENATRWLQGLSGVEFVDVVFVHLEDNETHDLPRHS